MQAIRRHRLMTVLTTSPLLIALMQTAASLPVVILGLLAGQQPIFFDRPGGC